MELSATLQEHSMCRPQMEDPSDNAQASMLERYRNLALKILWFFGSSIDFDHHVDVKADPKSRRYNSYFFI
jgi:hypothetical protein